jgi:pilus assembly protein CpaC
MTSRTITRRARLGTALAALAIGFAPVAVSSPAYAQSQPSYRPSGQVMLSVGEGQMVKMSRSIADVWVSNPTVADVHVTNARQLNLFGKENGEATVIATAKDGSVVYATNVRVGQNITSMNDMLRVAMPDSTISVTNVGQMAVINGTVASPADAAYAEALVRTLLNPGIDTSQPGAALKIIPVNRLKTAVPLQVMLKVKIAEVNRTLLKQIGVNLFSSDATSGFQFGIGQGSGVTPPGADNAFKIGTVPGLLGAGTALGAAGKLFGLDLAAKIDLAARDGVVTILAEPHLSALSGETASFLAGGEFPIPVPQGNGGGITIEYKQYGVGLAFTPVVLADGRISMRVRPEVSELSNDGAITVGDIKVPAITTRRAETTVELGSGQSFMIAGLLRNSNANEISKAPFLGDLPILGALFRSTSFKRSETELVIVVTPYLVRPVSGQLAMPTNGYRATSDTQQVLEGQTYVGQSGPRPVPVAPAPVIGGGAVASPGFKL